MGKGMYDNKDDVGFWILNVICKQPDEVHNHEG